MRSLFLSLVLSVWQAVCLAQVVVQIPTPPLGYQSPDMTMPAGKIFVNPKTIPNHHAGYSTIRVEPTGCGPLATGNLVNDCGTGSNYPRHDAVSGGPAGAFRLLCNPSHYAFDDPIVKPFQSGMSHLHQFFGNTSTDASRNPATMDEFGNSTCAGGIANRTGYWVPVLVYHCPAIDIGCDRSRDGEVNPAVSIDMYYKAEYVDDGAHHALVEWWPKGFRMIAGNAANIDPSNIAGRFDCGDRNSPQRTSGIFYTFDHLPSAAEVYTTHARGPQDTPPVNSAELGYVANPNGVGPPLNAVQGYEPSPCSSINMLIQFPHCSATDLTVLYLPTPVGGRYSGHVNDTYNCTSAGVTRIHPSVSYNIHTDIKNTADHDYYVLSSDLPMHPGVAQSGTTTTVTLAATENSVNDSFRGGYIVIGGQRRQISAYNGTTKVATLSVALSAAPAAGATYAARTAAGRSMHGDWANGWSQDLNFMGWGRKLTDQIIRGCYAVDIQRYGALPGLDIDCHANNIGDPRPSSVPEPSIGGVYYGMY